ncbi:hypothetical protein PsYK624_027780 [Phanerochaete sordida]|uniref:Uncharacterized protein n=1 Tax=Phanerochaete sordida TaxID=48140 RepID=A0A9P3LAE4_9APHY|nr:hypothetical protein PsYK624_027780 [Phanerochaete sordida]
MARSGAVRRPLPPCAPHADTPQTPYSLRTRTRARPQPKEKPAPHTPRRTRRLLPPRTPQSAGPSPGHYHPYNASYDALYEQVFGPADLDFDDLTDVPDDATVRGDVDDASECGTVEGSVDGAESVATEGAPRFSELHNEPVDKLFFMNMFLKTQHEDAPSVWQFCSAQEETTNYQTADAAPMSTPMSSGSGSSTFVPSSPAYDPIPMDGEFCKPVHLFTFPTGGPQPPAFVSAMAHSVPSEYDYPETISGDSDITMRTCQTDTVMEDASDASDARSDVTMRSAGSFRLSDLDSDDSGSDAGSECSTRTIISEYAIPPRRSTRIRKPVIR